MKLSKTCLPLGALFASTLLSWSSYAAVSERSIFHCTVEKIVATQWDLFTLPGGSQQELMVTLNCDEDTVAKGNHSPLMRAPFSVSADLQMRQQNHLKSEYQISNGGYAGDLIAIDGKAVGPLQPTARPGSNFDYRREKEFDESDLITQIYLQNCKDCKGETRFNARDASQFRVISSLSRSRGSSDGDGRGTPGDMHAFLIVQGAVEATQKPGDPLQLSPRDSIGLSQFLLMKKFPATIVLDDSPSASLTCLSASNCILIQE